MDIIILFFVPFTRNSRRHAIFGCRSNTICLAAPSSLPPVSLYRTHTFSLHTPVSYVHINAVFKSRAPQPLEYNTYSYFRYPRFQMRLRHAESVKKMDCSCYYWSLGRPNELLLTGYGVPLPPPPDRKTSLVAACEVGGLNGIALQYLFYS